MPPTVIPSAASAGRSSRFHRRDLRRRELEHALADSGERLLGREAVRRADGDSGLGLAEEAGDADLEELVHVRGEERAVVHALEKGQRLVGRELEHARVELEMRELPVEKCLDGLGACTGGHRLHSYRQHVPPGKDPVNAKGGRPRRAPLGAFPLGLGTLMATSGRRPLRRQEGLMASLSHAGRRRWVHVP